MRVERAQSKINKTSAPALTSKQAKNIMKFFNVADDFLKIITEDCLNVMKPELMVMGRDGRPVQRARRRFSVRESNKQVRS